MEKEIEKKYLIFEEGKDYSTKEWGLMFPSMNALRSELFNQGKLVYQGYMSPEEGMEVAKDLNIKLDFDPKMARLRDVQGTYYLSLKGEDDVERSRLEIQIDDEDFIKYWKKTEGSRLEKFRHDIKINGSNAHIDYFPLLDLVTVEVEAKTAEEISKFPALGMDITQNQEYKGLALVKKHSQR